jgi:hypothetical protein
MAALTTTRAVARFSTDTTLPRDVSEDMILREPNANPLFVLTNASKRKRPSDTPKFEWFEDQEVTFWGQASNGTTSYSSVATGIFVADVTIFAVGDAVAVPQAASSANAEELILVTAISGSTTGTLTVTRNVGGAGADTIGATASLRILGSSIAEDGATPTQRYQAQTNKVSYCQIFRTPVKITHTAASTKKYGGPDRKYQLLKGMIRHRSEIEAAGLWSRASETLSGSSSQWTSMGLKADHRNQQNRCFNHFDHNRIQHLLRDRVPVWRKAEVAHCSPKVLSALNFFSQNKLQTHVNDTVFGVQLTRYIVPSANTC